LHFLWLLFFFFFQAEDGIRDYKVTGVQTCALPISAGTGGGEPPREVPAAIPAAVARAAWARRGRVRPLGCARRHSGGCTMILPPALRQVSRLRPAPRSRSGTRCARKAAITSVAVWCATTSCVINSAPPPSAARPEPTWKV